VELDSQTQTPLRKRHVRRSVRRSVRLVLALLCLLLVAAYVLVPPIEPLAKSRLVGYAICHQIPERSFSMGGVHLPLCARCTGTYVGIAIAFAAFALLGRLRAGEMVSKGMLVVMALFILAMGVDGFNSYLSLLGRESFLYVPQNWLRAATGSLNGIALSTIVLPVFNFTLWKRPLPIRPFKNGLELIAVLVVTAGVVVTLQSEPSWLLYPASIVSAGGVLWMLTLVNTMILLIVFRYENRAETWRDAVPALLSGLAVALLELTAIGVIRYALTGAMGWPLAV
jgi:uncharacterized membrane protein